MKPETELAQRVVSIFKRFGFECIRLQSGVVRVRRGWLHGARKGTSDYLICGPRGAHRFVELKMPGETPTKDQLAWRDHMQRLGHIVDVVTSTPEALAIAREMIGGTS